MSSIFYENNTFAFLQLFHSLNDVTKERQVETRNGKNAKKKMRRREVMNPFWNNLNIMIAKILSLSDSFIFSTPHTLFDIKSQVLWKNEMKTLNNKMWDGEWVSDIIFLQHSPQNEWTDRGEGMKESPSIIVFQVREGENERNKKSGGGLYPLSFHFFPLHHPSPHPLTFSTETQQNEKKGRR